jgi:DNA-binding transcriptional regulator YdaS (Cro superfamily)
MTPTRLRECLALLRWSQRGLADALGRPEGTVRQWARGAVQIPPAVASWLEAAARWHASHPPPARQAPDP